MAYTTIALVRAASGMSDITNIPDASITAKIANADAIINGKLYGIYTIPLSATCPFITETATQITKALLYSSEYGEGSQDTDKGWEKILNYYMSLLDQVRSRSIFLLDANGAELDTSSLRVPVFRPTDATSAAGESDEPQITMTKQF